MGKGNLNKVDYIVDEIVKNNKNFKLKSIVEQNKEKEDIAKSINTALSALNEVGIDLVLKDLSVDPDEKFKYCIDNMGHIDVSGILKKTSDVVSSKIEEAQREGFDIRKGSPRVLNNEKELKKEAIITAITLGVMVNNFKNLSSEERATVVENWNRLNKDQQAEVMEDYSEIIMEGIDDLEEEKDKKVVKSYAEKLKRYSKEIKNGNKEAFNEEQKRKEGKKYIEYIQKEEPELYKDFLQSIKNKNESLDENDIVDVFGRFEAFRKEKAVLLAKEIAEERQRKKNGEQKGLSHKLLKEVSKAEKIDREFQSIMFGNNLKHKKEEQNDKEKNTQMFDKTQVIVQKLQDDKFSTKQIQESIELYKMIIEQLPQKHIERLENSRPEDRTNMLNVILTQKGKIEPEIAEVLSKIDYDGDFINILKDENRRKDLVEQLDKVIIQTKENEPEQPLITDSSIEEGIESGRFQQEELVVDIENVRTSQTDLETKEVSGSEDIKIENLTSELNKASEDVDKATQKVEIIDRQGAELNQEESQEAKIPEKEQEDDKSKASQGIDLANLLNSLSNMPDLTESAVIGAGKETGEVTKQVKVVDGKIVENTTDKTKEQNQDGKDEV